MLIKNAKILTPDVEHKNYFLITLDDKIFKLGRMEEFEEDDSFERVIDLENNYYICPGFIDIHTHGALGIDVTTQPERLSEISAYKSRNGVTMYLPTLMSVLNSLDEHTDQLQKLSKAIEKDKSYAKPLGINLETPYLSPECGMQQGKFNFPPTAKNNRALIEAAKGYLKIITIAPEIDGGIEAINFFNRQGIITGLGHSLSEIDLIEEAIDNGANLATHLYNGTYQKPARELGVIPASLNEYLAVRDDVWAEAISDYNGAHINPTIMKLLVKAKGFDKLIIITDNLFCTGLEDEKIKLADGRMLYKDYDVYRLENGHLGGSGYKLNHAVRNLRKNTGVQLIDGIKTITKNPAELLKIDHKVGSVRTGLNADLTVIDDDLEVYLTMVDGKICFEGLKT